MAATILNKIDTGRFPAADTTPAATATGTSGALASRRGTAGAGARDGPRRYLEAAVARGKRAVIGAVRGLRDGLARRQAIRRMRIMGGSRLADLGIEPDAIEHVVDAMLAARRSRAGDAGTMDNRRLKDPLQRTGAGRRPCRRVFRRAP